MSIKEIFDNISLSVIDFLENHQGVNNVQFFELGGCSEQDIRAWEKQYHPYTLPNDLKSFLSISNGLILRWSIMLVSSDSSRSIPLGNMHLNSLENIVPYDFRMEADILGLSAREKDTISRFRKTFILDSSGNGGRVCLVYIDDEKSRGKMQHNPSTQVHQNQKLTTKFNTPQVWFQDLGLEWNFIANSFTEYFRLLIMHLGLPHWQYAFTRVGLDPLSKQWFRFLSPERLAIDLRKNKSVGGDEHDVISKSRKKKKKKKKSKSASSKNEIENSETTEMDRNESGTDKRKTKRKKQKKPEVKKYHKLNLRKVTAALKM